MKHLTDPLIVRHHDLCLIFERSPRGLLHYALNPDPSFDELVPGIAVPPFQVAVAGTPHGFCSSMVTGLTQLPNAMALEASDQTPDRLTLRYRHPGLGLVVEVLLELVPGASALRCTTTAINDSPAPLVLTHLSSMLMQGIASDGLLPWHDPRKVRVHYCRQTWEGEGQWATACLQDLGVYPASVHPESTAFQVVSIGSFSTARHYPAAIVEDLETGKVWYFHIEASSSWHYEIARRGAWDDDSGALYLHAGAANERHLGWAHRLEPGGRFTTVPVAVGCRHGGLTEAVRELTAYRRTVLKPPPAWDGPCPVICNDYMNALWGDPTREKLVPLIDAAADAGAEAFCIDAGWFGDRDASWGANLGVWEPSRDRFGEGGLQAVLDYIRSRGLIPGLWLEMEVCDERAPIARRDDAWFLRRLGHRVGGGPRLFLNYANPEVRAHVHAVIDRLVAMGVGYFKNDYNDCVGPGDDTLGATAADGLLAHARAFYSFIDEVRRRHPRLILENCGSGAMRSDPGILAHFHLQSSSDQEFAELYPSVITGGLANILPEQYGIWVCPCPLLFPDRQRPEILDSPAYRARMADGEYTVFTLVNGLCGNLYLSGRIDKADDLNRALLQEGVALYKQERAHIHAGYPLWPLGFNRINDRDSWAALGIADEPNRRVLLAVWRRDSAADRVTLPLHGWQGRAAVARQLFPAQGFDVPFHYHRATGALTVALPRPCTARYFEVREA